MLQMVFVFFSDGILSQDVLMLNFFPQLNESEFSNNHEFVFVIDRSGMCHETLLTLIYRHVMHCLHFGTKHCPYFVSNSRMC